MKYPKQAVIDSTGTMPEVNLDGGDSSAGAKSILRARKMIGKKRNLIYDDRFSPLELFGTQLIKIRRKKNLTVADISELSNIDIATLDSIELGLLPFNEVAQCIPAISEAIGIDAQELSFLLFKTLFVNDESMI